MVNNAYPRGCAFGEKAYVEENTHITLHMGRRIHSYNMCLCGRGVEGIFF